MERGKPEIKGKYNAALKTINKAIELENKLGNARNGHNKQI